MRKIDCRLLCFERRYFFLFERTVDIMRNIEIVAVDFDGTLTLSDDRYPECGDISHVAVEILKEFRRNGGKVILWTCRYGAALDKAVQFCHEYGLEFDAVNDNLPEQSAKWRETHPNAKMSRKIYADLYIDDKNPKAILEGGVHWDTVCKLLVHKSLAEFFLSLWRR